MWSPGRAAITPLTWKDPQTGVTLHVESDGRHVSAIAPTGALLWRCDPFVDAGLKPYRSARPTIFRIGHVRTQREGPSGTLRRVVGLTYDSTQFGDLDLQTGEFFFRGQD